MTVLIVGIMDLEYKVANLQEDAKILKNFKQVSFIVTAYESSEQSCGPWAKYLQTKTGTTPSALRTIAVDPAVIPLGSLVYIEGIGWRLAEDTGRLITGHHIDIFCSTKDKAKEFGIQNRKVYYQPVQT